MNTTSLPTPRPTVHPATAPWLLPALLACYLVWGSTYLAIRVALDSFRRFSRWAPASWWRARC